MSPEAQDKVIKFGGAAIAAALIILAARLLKGETEMLLTIVSIVSWGLGVLGWNSPIRGVQQMRGLVSLNAPSQSDVEKMRQVVVSSTNPPAGDAS